MDTANPVDRNQQVGFVGLGWMGHHFAERLLATGWRLAVFDRVAEKCAPLAAGGARVAASTEELVRGCGVVLFSLPSSAVFAEVAVQSVVPLARTGQIIVDLGTTELGETRRLAAALAERGASLLDAPVSGDPRSGVHVFVGGEEQAFHRALPLLRELAGSSPVTLGGGSGSGQILKGLNQLCMGLVRAAWLEAVSFATRQGLSPETVKQAVGGTGGWRAELAGIAQQIAEGKGEQNDLKFAELPYFLQAAEGAGIELPLTRALFEFCEPGPRDWRDNMGRPYVSFWHMLNRTGQSTEGA